VNAQLLTTLNQQVSTYRVKRLFEVDKDNIEALTVVLGSADKMVQGENTIKCAIARSESTLGRGAQA
jgi:hypothetical protein